jgi:hypothetical protein
VNARTAGLLAAVATVLAACGGGSSDVVRAPSTSGSTVATSSSPSRSSPSPSAPTVRRPVLDLVPATGLRDGQNVAVHARGFTPGTALQVIECADKGAGTGAGDCNLTGMIPVTADANGRVDTTLKVLRGPFGANRIVCGEKVGCLVSVTQATLSPTEEADHPITFG